MRVILALATAATIAAIGLSDIKIVDTADARGFSAGSVARSFSAPRVVRSTPKVARSVKTPKVKSKTKSRSTNDMPARVADTAVDTLMGAAGAVILMELMGDEDADDIKDLD